MIVQIVKHGFSLVFVEGDVRCVIAQTRILIFCLLGYASHFFFNTIYQSHFYPAEHQFFCKHLKLYKIINMIFSQVPGSIFSSGFYLCEISPHDLPVSIGVSSGFSGLVPPLKNMKI